MLRLVHSVLPLCLLLACSKESSDSKKDTGEVPADADTGTGTETDTDTDTDADTDTDTDTDWAGGDAELNIELSDYGSGGDSATGNTVRITLFPGIVTVFPFTTNAEPRHGSVVVVPTSSGLPVDGSQVRMWMSNQPGGPPLVADSTCSQNVGFEGALTWDHAGVYDWACQVDRSSSYFVNLRLCIAPRLDRTCSSPEARDGDEAADLYISGYSNLRE